MAATEHLLKHCLYFSANSLARAITRLAEEAFNPTGLSPSHAFLLMLVIEQPGITPTELAGHLHLAPSTVTRLIDVLRHKNLVEKKTRGKSALIYPTKEGAALTEPLAASWKALYDAYSGRIGEEAGRQLTGKMNEAAERLERV